MRRILLSRGLVGLFVLCWCTELSAREQSANKLSMAGEELTESGARAGTPWLSIGTFRGAAGQGLLGKLGNFLYEYERDDSLFRDLGDLGIGVGWDIGSVEFDLDFNFRHRVVTAHETLTPGEKITADDLSFYRTVDVSRTRLRTNYRYITDIIIDGDGIGVEVEGGFSVAMARAQRTGVQTDEALEALVPRSPEEERQDSDDEEDSSREDRGVVYITAGSAASVVDSLGGQMGKKFADTERAAIYWDNYADPLMLFPKAGLPLKTRIFMGDDPTLAIGDTLTFTSFVGISPIVAGIRDYGLRINYKRFVRLIRETTVVKEPDSVVLVRVRNWRANGGDFTPFKIRPELRLWIVTVGYTFFETVRDKFRERVSDSVYRIDLKTEAGMKFFRRLVKKSGRVQATPNPPEVEEGDGVEIVASEVNRGRNQNVRVRANFFDWLFYRKTKLATTKRIHTRDAELRELIRLRMREYRKKIGRDRNIRNRSVIVLQSNVEWRSDAASKLRPEDEKLAVIFSSNYSNLYASQEEIKALAEGVESLLDLKEPLPIFEEIRSQQIDEPTRLMIDLSLSFGPSQLEQAFQVSDKEVWTTLAELLMGPEYREIWNSEAKRYWWQPGAPLYRGVDPPVADIARYYDGLRGFQGRPGRRSRVFNPDEYRSRDLFRLAEGTFDKLQKLNRVIAEQADCLRCLVKGYSTGKDVLLIQALTNRFSGGVETGGVGYHLRIQVGDMVRPLEFSNGIVHGYQLPRGPEVVQTAETIWDAPPRLRAGQMLLNVSGREALLADGGPPCWKLRLFSDHVFDEDLSLQIHWRHNRPSADRSIEVGFAPLGEPSDFLEALREGRVEYARVTGERPLGSEYSTGADRTLEMRRGLTGPFGASYEQALYFYEVPLPWLDAEYTKKGYTLLLRVLNPDGAPVTEEQEILMKLPRDWQEQVPRQCWQGVRQTADLTEGSSSP